MTMKKTPFSVKAGLTVMALGIVGITGMTANNVMNGSAVARGLAVEIAASDAALSANTVDCMSRHAAAAIQTGSMLRPGPMPDADTLRTDAMVAARIACAA